MKGGGCSPHQGAQAHPAQLSSPTDAMSAASQLLAQLHGLPKQPTPGNAAVRRPSKDLDDREVLRKLTQLVITHDRQIQRIEDTQSVVILLWSLAAKKDVQTCADAWRAALPPRTSDKVGKGSGSAADPADARRAAHPLGCGLRTVVHAAVVTQLQLVFASATDGTSLRGQTTLSKLSELPTQAIEQGCLRLVPVHKQFFEAGDRPWAWTLTFGHQTKEDSFRDLWVDLARLFNHLRGQPAWTTPLAEVRVPHNRDGNLTKQLAEWSGLRTQTAEDDDEEMGSQRAVKSRRSTGGPGFLRRPPLSWLMWGAGRARCFQADREIVLAAVSQNGIALQYASAELRRDRHIVHTAVRDVGIALEYAAEELQADRKIVLSAVQSSGLAIEYAARELRGVREIALAAVTESRHAIDTPKQYWHILRITVLSGRQVVFLGHDRDEESDVVEYVCDALELPTSRGHLVHEGEIIGPRRFVQDWPGLREPGEVSDYQLVV
eukprot:6490235-Amphidinium_carterae.2